MHLAANAVASREMPEKSGESAFLRQGRQRTRLSRKDPRPAAFSVMHPLC
jgi:hypothetical protein